MQTQPDLAAKALEVYRLLTERYGERPLKPRREPMHELISTMLSQRTTNANEALAFQRMWDHFGSWEANRARSKCCVTGTKRIGRRARKQLNNLATRIEASRHSFQVTTVMDTKVFISYSRKEFYFAEQLATLLKSKYGINAWFDIHELQAGMDWSAAIQSALTGCDALVLVASKASLGSPWVRVEWEPTLKAGKPVIVAFFERVELPPELSNVPRIDLRGDFERGVERLANALRADGTVSDPLPRGLRFPPAVWIVIAAYLSPLLLLPVLPGLAVALLLPLLYLLRQFLRRAYTVAEQRNAFLVLIVGMLLIALITVFNQNMYEFQVTPHVPLILTSSAVILLMLTARQLMRHNPVLYRWSPTGEGGQSVRERVNREVRQAQGLQFSDLGKTFRLQFDPADQQVASDVRQALEGAHYREVQDGLIPDHDIVVVSDRTPATLLENAGEGQREVITVVATAFKVPESAKNLSRYQWIDYRKRSPEALRNMVEDMYLRDTGGANLQYALMPVPENFTAMRLPQRTDLLVQAFNIIGVLNALGAVLMLLTTGNTPPTDMFGNPIPFNPLDAVYLLAASGVLLLLARLIRRRAIRYLPALIGGIAALFISLVTVYGLSNYGGVLISLLPCITLTGFIVLLHGGSSLRRWLL